MSVRAVADTATAAVVEAAAPGALQREIKVGHLNSFKKWPFNIDAYSERTSLGI